jgi:hypothetical protein
MGDTLRATLHGGDAQATTRGSAPAVSPLLLASRRVEVLDYYRVPYEVDPSLSGDGLERVCAPHGGPALVWAPATHRQPAAMAELLSATEVPIPICARIASDDAVRQSLAELGGSWSRNPTVTSAGRQGLAPIWRRDDGSVFLPFDPDEVVHNYWSESYAAAAGGRASRHVRRFLMMSYYRVRPLMPRRLQIWSRRQFARIQARCAFPRWPAEPGLHDFLEFLLATMAGLRQQALPVMAPWPRGHTWAFVLTHDVEHDAGWSAIDPVLDLERAHGLRSSWNLVPRRYQVDFGRVQRLVQDGFEVGVHGLYHDGRDLESRAMLEKRLSGIREAAERWDATGFRAPAMHRNWELMPLTGFQYDLSYPDTDPFEPQAGGCCSWLPFFNGDLVELPTTLVGDHTLFVILRHDDEACWVTKTEFLRDRGGLALMNAHPDYLVNERIFGAYARYLDRFAEDDTAWKTIPAEVADWWRRRAASTIELRGEDFVVAGPAAGEARIQFVEPHQAASRRAERRR